MMETQLDFCCFPQKQEQKPLRAGSSDRLISSCLSGKWWCLASQEWGGVCGAQVTPSALRVCGGTDHSLSSESLWGYRSNPQLLEFVGAQFILSALRVWRGTGHSLSSESLWGHSSYPQLCFGEGHRSPPQLSGIRRVLSSSHLLLSGTVWPS